MGDRELQAYNKGNSHKRSDIEFIQEKFGIKQTIENLHNMAIQVTKEDFSAQNVNAACHCVHQLNQTMDTVIKAAKFLRENG